MFFYVANFMSIFLSKKKLHVNFISYIDKKKLHKGVMFC